MSLIKKIKDYYNNGSDEKNTLFTTPSHEQGKFLPPLAKELLGEKFFKCDFSEIEGFDNLRNPNGILKSVLNKLTKIYQSKQTFILTNGSTSGMLAMLMSVVKEGDKVLVARNCHISVYNALVVTGAVPVWFMPDFDDDWGIYKGITADIVRNNLERNTGIKAVVLTSPTYEGLFSDIDGISKVCKECNAKLLVDEAHGALLNFGDFKTKPAILCGADMSIQSLHKTAGAPNPCALLHIAKHSQVSSKKVQQSLNIINTTSPSYPLILACEICVDFLSSAKGKDYLKKLVDSIDKQIATLPEGVSVYKGFNDTTKILLRVNGVNALSIAEILNNKFCIEEEFSTEQSLLFICGIGTTQKKIERLFSSLADVCKNQKTEPLSPKSDMKYTIPKMVYTPKEAFQKESSVVNARDSVGKISAVTLSAYPPGVPFVIAGEIIDENIVDFISGKQIEICI